MIKQIEGLTDVELVDLVGTKIGRMIGYREKPDYSIFSKVRERADPAIFEDLNKWILQDHLKGKQLRLLAQDSTDIPAFSRKDKHARPGHRTPSKREQEDANGNANDMFFGYKLHAIADAENEVPIGFFIAPGNRHDSVFFHRLLDDVKSRFCIAFGAKFLADSGYDATRIYKELHYENIKAVIAINGRGHRKSETPKDPEYGKRWSIERIFSRLKVVFGLTNNKFIGMKKVSIHIYSCLIAYLMTYLM
ncbi:transposase [Candidatus Marsarchaeota archaeon]|nr:transposase [Candidatus Marsarchaeota archaeon]